MMSLPHNLLDPRCKVTSSSTSWETVGTSQMHGSTRTHRAHYFVPLIGVLTVFLVEFSKKVASTVDFPYLSKGIIVPSSFK
ncbi:hypothetical protein ACHQM5_029044 [Ranunculus cassubicifolius]